MKKILLLLVCTLVAVGCYAVPVYPHPVKHIQPDGSTLMIQGHGDEFYNFVTTVDGYTIQKNDQGFYVYVQKVGDVLVRTDCLAHDAAQRSADENAFLANVEKYARVEMAESNARKARRQVATKESYDYYKNFRGLVILVNFSDKTFQRSDAQEFYTHMFNDENYAGYKNENGTSNSYGNMFIGGVRDYFNANSNGIFVPQFDLIGPVTIDMGCKEVNSTSNAYNVWLKALAKADELVDFSKYDADGNGTVDMLYFIVAGYGANYSGNDSGYLWPHKSSLSYYSVPAYDGMKFGTFASSVEIYGWESQGSTVIDGIGTVCHEFSHVLGLPDIYDTDYSTNGQSHDPGNWSVMAGGSYNQYGRLPVGYSAFERFASGFLKYPTITKAGKYTLGELQSTGEGYIINTPNDGEYFVLENRQQNSWDVKLPGHGMLVTRIDSTSSVLSYWRSNKVNAYSAHNCVELLRASGSTSGASTGDPFPGTSNVTSITNETTATLKTWDGQDNPLSITGITESNGVITFDVGTDDDLTSVVEDFETMGIQAASSTGVQGRFTTWDFSAKAQVVSTSSETYGNGSYCGQMVKPGYMVTAKPIMLNPYRVTISCVNKTSTDEKIVLQYKDPSATEWTTATPEDVTVGKSSTVTASFAISHSGPMDMRIYQSAGSTSGKMYIDDITLHYYKSGVVTSVAGDVNDDGSVDVADVTALVNYVLEPSSITINTTAAELTGDSTLDVADITALIILILGE